VRPVVGIGYSAVGAFMMRLAATYPPLVKALVLVSSAGGGVPVIRNFFAPDPETDPMPPVSQVRVPTLVMRGTADRLALPEVTQNLAGGIEGAQLYLFEGRGHAPLFTATTEFCAVVATSSGRDQCRPQRRYSRDRVLPRDRSGIRGSGATGAPRAELESLQFSRSQLASYPDRQGRADENRRSGRKHDRP
jgi:pimeloyl-ACP methyl ester carboxylesterase